MPKKQKTYNGIPFFDTYDAAKEFLREKDLDGGSCLACFQETDSCGYTNLEVCGFASDVEGDPVYFHVSWDSTSPILRLDVSKWSYVELDLNMINQLRSLESRAARALRKWDAENPYMEDAA